MHASNTERKGQDSVDCIDISRNNRGGQELEREVGEQRRDGGGKGNGGK